MARYPDYNNVSTGLHQFPSRDIVDKEKDQEWYSLEYAQAIYNRYLNDKCGILYSAREDLDLIRLYGKGAQPNTIYKEWHQERANDDDEHSALSSYRNDKTRQGWENVSTRVVSPLPRIRTIIKGYLDQVGQDVFVDAVDALSNDMKENMKHRMAVVSQHLDFINEYKVKAGIPQEELEFIPVNQTELALYEAMGGFKLNSAREMEKIVRYTEKLSEVNDDLKDRWIDDATDIGVICARSVYDHNMKKYRYKYIDPKYFVIQFVEEGDYTRSEYAGHIEKKTISELKQLLPDKTEDYFKELAFVHRGRLGNAGVDSKEWDNFSKHSNRTGAYNYDDFIVEVLEAEWIDYTSKRNLVYVNKYGHKTVRDLGKDSEVKLTENQKKRGSKDLRSKMRKLRGCKWVIGTDTVYDYGLVNMSDRPKQTEVMHSYRMYTLRDEPITEQLIPVADDMALAWYRWQNDRAMLQTESFALDVGMLENLREGGDEFNLKDVLKFWRETRYLLHQQSMSGRYEGGNVTPVQPIPSLLNEALERFVMEWESALKRIEDITGINLVLLGATAPEKARVATTEMSIQSAAHVLRPMVKLIGRMKNELAETTVRRLQLAFKSRKDIADGYVDIIGQNGVELLKQAEKDAVQYGLFFEDKPSQKMKDDILDAARASLEARRQGQPGIEISQYLYISQQMEAGANLKELTALLDYLQLKSQQTIQENKERDIQLQNEGLAQIEQQKAQAKAQEQKMETQGKIMEEREKRITEMMKIKAEQEGVANVPGGGMGGNARTGAPQNAVGARSPSQRGGVPQR